MFGSRHCGSSIGGLGGCPVALDATGNVATEDVVVMLEQVEFDTKIDLTKLVAAVDLPTELMGS
jgi:hydroxymethylglutaryl-CoA lyase